MSILNLLLSLLFPRRCVVCGQFGRYLCHKCQIKIKPLEFQVCPVCERPAIGGATHPKCQSRYGLDGLTSFFIYDGPIKKAIKELKYRFVTDLAQELISLTKEAPHSVLFKNFILTPIPLHRRRLNWRGFNQAEILGKLISTRLKSKFVPDLLIRKKHTRPQVELESKKRKENIEGAFIINPNYQFLIPNIHILLFDDVWTTGSTLRTAGKVLKQAGVREVWGMTLAR